MRSVERRRGLLPPPGQFPSVRAGPLRDSASRPECGHPLAAGELLARERGTVARCVDTTPSPDRPDTTPATHTLLGDAADSQGLAPNVGAGEGEQATGRSGNGGLTPRRLTPLTRPLLLPTRPGGSLSLGPLPPPSSSPTIWWQPRPVSFPLRYSRAFAAPPPPARPEDTGWQPIALDHGCWLCIGRSDSTLCCQYGFLCDQRNQPGDRRHGTQGLGDTLQAWEGLVA